MKNAEKTIAIEDMQKKDLKVLLEHEYKYMMDKEIRKNAKDVLDRYAEAPAKVKKAELLAAIKSDNKAWTKFNENMNKSHEKKVQEKAKKAEASKKKEQVETSLKLAKKSSPKKEVEKAPKKVEEEPKELPVFPDTLEVGDTTYEKINDKMTWKELNKLCSEEDVVMVHRESDDFMKVYEKEMNVKLPSGGIPDNLDIYQPVFVGEMRHMIVAASVYTEAVVFLQELKSTKDGDYAFDDETPMAFFVASSEENEEE
jgi:Asp-tRNA(Asn)/Glu-tRNA(Gln) amidotransferase A subunit family amidase